MLVVRASLRGQTQRSAGERQCDVSSPTRTLYLSAVTVSSLMSTTHHKRRGVTGNPMTWTSVQIRHSVVKFNIFTISWSVIHFKQFTATHSKTILISRPTPRLLSFVLCLEWINGTYNTIHSRHSIDTPHTVWSVYRPHGWVGTTTPKIDRKHTNWRNMPEIRTRYTVKIVNKRPCNLLNEIQNVFINGKQVKPAKITQIIPWFSQF